MATLIERNTAKLMKDRLQKELDQLFNEQESHKIKRSVKKAPEGTKVQPFYADTTKLKNLNLGQMVWDPRKRGVNPLQFVNGNIVRDYGLASLFNENFNKLASSPKYVSESKEDKKPFDWTKFGNIAMEAAPALYNVFKGLQEPDDVVANYNPYENEIRSAMRNRRFNIDPLLNQNRMAQAITNRNIRNTARSRGEQLGNYGASQNYRMTGDAGSWATKINADNQYLAEQAQVDYGLGRDRSQMDWNVQLAEAQNKAARNQFMGQGMSDVSNLAQTRELMGNQADRDKQLLELYPDMFKSIMPFMTGMQNIMKEMGYGSK